MSKQIFCPICDKPFTTHPPTWVACDMINKLRDDNRELREVVGKLQGLLNLQQDIKGTANGQT
jgi:hypothetical protein